MSQWPVSTHQDERPFSIGHSRLKSQVDHAHFVSLEYHRCVISKFDDDVEAVCSCTVMYVQGVLEWAEDAALRSTSVEDQGR